MEILEAGAMVNKKARTRRLEGFHTIVLAVGTKSVDSLKAQLAPACRLYVIGDALAPRKAIDAIAEGAAGGPEVVSTLYAQRPLLSPFALSQE